LDWYFARDPAGLIKTAPAVIVLDILQGGNLVAGFIARRLARNGLHAFILHLPQNGRRMKAGVEHDWNFFLPSLRQGASDARRARDVVAALPMVSGGVSLQGTSLGGFVATAAAGIDGCFDSTILALTGGDAYGILTHGKMDAVRVREQLRNVGFTDSKLKDWVWQIEPLRMAHRLKPSRTWLFSAKYDQVIPAKHSKLLADRINLDWSHHRHLTGCHYTCAINANRFLQEMTRAIQQKAVERKSA
jgi:dienelactone hydrolase